MDNEIKFVTCFPFGVGVSADPQLMGIARQFAEDYSEILPLLKTFVSVPQNLIVRQSPDITYDVSKNAQAMAVFYSLPETDTVIRATKDIGAHYALVGRITQRENGLILSLNILDVDTRILHFCGMEKCNREEIPLAIATMGARLLSHFSEQNAAKWLPDVFDVLGTKSFVAYVNWVSMRELERKSLLSDNKPNYSRLAEYLIYAIAADPNYHKALRKLTWVLRESSSPASLKLLIKQFAPLAEQFLPLGLLTSWAYRQLDQEQQAEALLRVLGAKFPGVALSL